MQIFDKMDVNLIPRWSDKGKKISLFVLKNKNGE